MAVPSRPNPRVGLPSSPAPRSRSLSARTPRQDIPPRPSSAANVRPQTQRPLPPLPNRLRSQRSLNDLSSPALRRIPRIPPPPLPVFEPVSSFGIREDSLSLYGSRKPLDGSLSSISSATLLPPSSTTSSHTSLSSASSLFSSRSPSSSASSTSSYDDEDVLVSETEDKPPTTESLGAALWTRVTAAAGSLTVSVSKALETNIVSYAGESTPLGQDSRLTRAMKAYYTAKAREPSDLPDWLFEERDRGVIGRLQIVNATAEDDIRRAVAVAPPIPPVAPVHLPMPAGIGIIATDVTRKSVAGSVNPSRHASDGQHTARVRFLEQVHPRRLRSVGPEGARNVPLPPQKSIQSVPPPSNESFAMVRTPAASPSPRMTAKLADVNLHGRRPSAQGLPSGVRPQRPRVPVQ